jgi:hypothetical protein
MESFATFPPLAQAKGADARSVPEKFRVSPGECPDLRLNEADGWWDNRNANPWRADVRSRANALAGFETGS